MQTEIVDVAIIGAGFAGIGAAVKLREAGIQNIRIFEKTDGISGTWHDNTYPGAACDVASHLYCYSFAPNPNWSRIYSPQSEIKAYVEGVVDRHQLRALIRFNSEITKADYDASTGRWDLITAKGDKINARFVLWSVAFLGQPTIPEFEGLQDFAGPVFHSARWDHSIDLMDKNVVVVGSAASALQLGPTIAPKVKSLTMFQRTANYVMQRDDRAYSSFEKFLFRRLPFWNRILRGALFLRHDNFFFYGMAPGSWINTIIRKRSLGYLKSKIKDPVLREKLTGKYQLGCKRILISDNFYDMFLRENVSLNTDGIAKFHKDAVQTKTGEKIPADIVVMATGFAATEFMPGIEMNGVDGANLEQWRGDLRALKGLLVAGFPNAFFLLGPNTGLGHSSMILMIESQLRYINQAITTLRGDETLAPKPAAVKAYNQQIQSELATSIWATSCQSWYKRADGFIPTMWPRSTKAYDKMMRKVNWDELDVKQV